MTRARAVLAAALLLAAPARANMELSALPRERPADLAVIPVDPGVYDEPVPETEEEAEAAATPEPEGPRVPGVAMKGLDKFSGIVRRFDAPLGGPVEYERLTIWVQACEPGAANRGDAAFVTVQDRRNPEVAAFQGWMFADSPALSALDHPRYDVWVLSCSTVSASAP